LPSPVIQGDEFDIELVAFLQDEDHKTGKQSQSESNTSKRQAAMDDGVRTASNSIDIKPIQIHPITGGLTPSFTDPGSLNVLTIPTLVDPIQEPDVVPLTLETLNSRRATAEERDDLDEPTKKQLQKHFNRAAELLSQAAEADNRDQTWKMERDNAPQLIADLKTQLDQPAPITIDHDPALSSQELEQLRITDEQRLSEAQSNLDKWEVRATQRAERLPQMAGIIEAARKQLEDAEIALKAPAPEGESAVLAIARRTEQEAFAVFLKAQLELYRTEQQRYESLNELFPLQRDLLTRNCKLLSKRVELWKEAITKARLLESEQQRRQARVKLQNAHPALRDLAERNSWLTQQRKEQQQGLKKSVARLVEIQDTFRRIDQQFRDDADKEKRIGFTTAFGLLLRNHRSNLPDAKPFRKLNRAAEQAMVLLQTEQMQLEDDRKDLVDIEFRIQQLLDGLSTEARKDEDLPKMARELLSDQRQYTDDLLADYTQFLSTQSEIATSSEKLVATLREYGSFLDERILWIASAPMVDADLPRATFRVSTLLASHQQWPSVRDYFYVDIRSQLMLYAAVLAAIILLVFLRLPASKAISHLHQSAQQEYYSGVPQSILATLVSVAVTSAWPALLLFVGWRLSQADQQLSIALGEALRFGAIHFLVLNSVRGLCEREGVAHRFLNWPKRVVDVLHRALLVYISLGVPLQMVVSFTSNFDEFDASANIGRVALVSCCLLWAVVLRGIARPKGVIGTFIASHGEANPLMRWICYGLALSAPLGLAVLPLLGYQYTTQQLLIRFELTMGLAFLLFATYSMFTRWIMAARKKLALQQVQSRRDATTLSAPTGEGAILIDIPQVDLSLLNQQALKVWRAATILVFLCGCWLVWSQVLPALQVFSRVELWSYTVESRELAKNLNDELTWQEITKVQSITLGHFLLAIGVLAVTVLGGRNLPGVLEFSFLQRLQVDQGARTAFSKLTGYALVVAGVIVATNIIGLRWSSIQWLVAALTVGLGFGLQEIFANFVSGVIILFERPVRVGDVVTIDNVTGTVSRIQIRATTITDLDFKEFIVPNKEFVTGRLMNWTLSDRRSRLVVEIGVAYNTDIDKALRILQQIASDNPSVLADPEPIVTFESFGESTLQLMLRVFLGNVDHRWLVRTQLNSEIAKRFQAAEITFAYPQRDLHICTVSSDVVSMFAAENDRSTKPAANPDVRANAGQAA
jgi:potassium efflux system protein